ncbi:MAG: type I-E CRISPR-associated protein Cas6/Cse3/CasE [Acetobacteraceae bacterium]|nr:type I-E CRISPR-associated protein Cas6/Cse3/CasE [Acetobacteraceae bacterium]
MSELWLSRARLKRDAPVAALARLLVPDGTARTGAAHHLVWAMFADGPERQRDFLWREEGPGRFMALSRRPPVNIEGLFELDFQPFAPVLALGDRLSFTLRANPVVARATAPGQRGKRHDVVMDALKTIAPGQRAEARPDAVITAGRAWLARQGAAHGFKPEGEIAVDGYDRVVVARETGKPAVFGILDISGVLTVTDPMRFLAAQEAGFGRARAFGCGLMLIRRAR